MKRQALPLLWESQRIAKVHFFRYYCECERRLKMLLQWFTNAVAMYEILFRRATQHQRPRLIVVSLFGVRAIIVIVHVSCRAEVQDSVRRGYVIPSYGFVSVAVEKDIPDWKYIQEFCSFWRGMFFRVCFFQPARLDRVYKSNVPVMPRTRFHSARSECCLAIIEKDILDGPYKLLWKCLLLFGPFASKYCSWDIMFSSYKY